MFRLPTSFSDFIIRSLKTLPYLAVAMGPLFAVIGIWYGISTNNFISSSYEASIIVVHIDQKDGENGQVYRPVFVLADDKGRVEYSGNLWVSPKPHSVGDVVRGRHAPSSGVTTSDHMLRSAQSLSSTFRNMGLILFALGFGYLWWKRRSAKTI